MITARDKRAPRGIVAKPLDVTVAIRNGDLIGPSELALAFTGVRQGGRTSVTCVDYC